MKRFVTRWAALALALVLALGLIPAAAADSPFTDVTDRQTAQDVEVLRMLGAIDGVTATSFNPTGTLTRAQFCKIAVEVLGQGDRVGAYENYTIFPDVKSGHWASGYVNLAVRGENKFISGYSDGTFKPNNMVTFGQAVTILMRLLGYTDEDVGAVWPEGYLDAAARIGLTDGVKLSGSDAVTRAQAAHLFVNLLNADLKEGGSFLNKIGTPHEDVVMLNANTTTGDGSPAVLTTGDPEPVPVAGKTGSASLSGRKGTLVTNSAGKVLTFVPSSTGASHDVTVSSADTGTITASTGTRFTVTADTVTYYKGEQKTWGDVVPFIRTGALATVYVGTSGKVEYVFIGESTSEDAVIVSANGSTAGFELLTDRTDYKLYKNGETVTAAALKQYDVATYSSANNTVYVSDNRLTGYYADVYPNTSDPLRIEIACIEGEFDVLPSARDSLSKYKLGQTVTLLLTYDNRVAGASTSSSLRGNSVGYVESLSGGEATVKMLNGLTAKGKTSSADSMAGQLVTVSTTGKDRLSLSRLSSKGVSGSFDVAARIVGSTPLAGNVTIYEKAGNSKMQAVSLSDLPAVTISSDKVLYARRNYADKVDVLVLENATGNLFTYGRVTVGETPAGSWDGETFYNKTVSVEYGSGKTTKEYLCAAFSKDGQWGGIVPTADDQKVAAYVVLDQLKNVPVSAWRSDKLVQFDGVAYTVSENVVCYNKTTGRWFDSLGEALVFADRADLYVDANHVVRGVEVQ